MEKLKTLKDLKKPELKSELLNKDKLVSRIELKQEAIKEIKLIRKAITEYGIENGKSNLNEILPFCDAVDIVNLADWRGALGSIEVYIKWKFDISEEELL